MALLLVLPLVLLGYWPIFGDKILLIVLLLRSGGASSAQFVY